MSARTTLVTVAVVYAIGAVACEDKDTSAECANALISTNGAIDALCAQFPYKASQFCRICVPNGFYSVDDSCTCRSLTFNTNYCYYSKEPGSSPDIRTALDYAVQVCSDRAAQLPYSCAELDATATDGQVVCPELRPSSTIEEAGKPETAGDEQSSGSDAPTD
jgi:hypothetical protein